MAKAVAAVSRRRLLLVVLLGCSVGAISGVTLAANPPAIQIAPIAEPGRYGIVSVSGPGGQYDSRTFVPGAGATQPSSFDDAMRKEGLHLGAELSVALRKALQGAGLEIAQGTQAADAVLTVAFGSGVVGYSDAALGDDLMPGFSVAAVLKDATSGQILMQMSVAYGEASAATQTIYPDASYRFTSPDAVVVDAAAAAAGLRAGLGPVAEAIATAIKENARER